MQLNFKTLKIFDTKVFNSDERNILQKDIKLLVNSIV